MKPLSSCLPAIEVPSPGKPGYTLFVPRDDAFWRLFVQDATAPDPFILDDDFRLETLLNHVAVGRFFSFDLKDGDEITTVGGKTLKGAVQKRCTSFVHTLLSQFIRLVNFETKTAEGTPAQMSQSLIEPTRSEARRDAV